MATLDAGFVTLFPEWVERIGEYGVIGRAVKEQQVRLHTWNPRDYSDDRHRRVDDRPYGGGPGMVLRPEPLLAALAAARESLGAQTRAICLSPQGKLITQQDVAALTEAGSFILVSGRYEGIDERAIALGGMEEWSVGDFLMSGGELPALCVLDAAARLLPGVLGNEESARFESFNDDLLECPHYTRPEEYQGQAVPEVLLGGDHQAIERWRRGQSVGRTWQRRPDLWGKRKRSAEDEALLAEYRKALK